MHMCLKHNRSGADDFSPLASLIAWGTYQIETPMRRRQGVRLRKCALASGLPGPIHVDHEPSPSRPVAATFFASFVSHEDALQREAKETRVALIRTDFLPDVPRPSPLSKELRCKHI